MCTAWLLESCLSDCHVKSVSSNRLSPDLHNSKGRLMFKSLNLNSGKNMFIWCTATGPWPDLFVKPWRALSGIKQEQNNQEALDITVCFSVANCLICFSHKLKVRRSILLKNVIKQGNYSTVLLNSLIWLFRSIFIFFFAGASPTTGLYECVYSNTLFFLYPFNES